MAGNISSLRAAVDPLLSFAPRFPMSTADISGRSLTPDPVRTQRWTQKSAVSKL